MKYSESVRPDPEDVAKACNATDFQKQLLLGMIHYEDGEGFHRKCLQSIPVIKLEHKEKVVECPVCHYKASFEYPITNSDNYFKYPFNSRHRTESYRTGETSPRGYPVTRSCYRNSFFLDNRNLPGLGELDRSYTMYSEDKEVAELEIRKCPDCGHEHIKDVIYPREVPNSSCYVCRLPLHKKKAQKILCLGRTTYAHHSCMTPKRKVELLISTSQLLLFLGIVATIPALVIYFVGFKLSGIAIGVALFLLLAWESIMAD